MSSNKAPLDINSPIEEIQAEIDRIRRIQLDRKRQEAINLAEDVLSNVEKLIFLYTV